MTINLNPQRDPEEAKLWRDVFVQALAITKSVPEASTTADYAVKAYRERQGA